MSNQAAILEIIKANPELGRTKMTRLLNEEKKIAISETQVRKLITEARKVEVVVEMPVAEMLAAVETPVIETPAVETPVIETPAVEAPVTNSNTITIESAGIVITRNGKQVTVTKFGEPVPAKPVLRTLCLTKGIDYPATATTQNLGAKVFKHLG